MNRRKFLKNSAGLFVPSVFGIISSKADVVFRPWNANVPPASGGSTLLNGLTAYFPLSDLTDSTGGASLTNTNTVTFVAGKVGNCANFVSASSQRLSRANGAAFQMGTGPFSFACWFNTSQSAVNQGIAEYSLSGGVAGYGVLNVTGTIRGSIESPPGGITNSCQNNTFADGAWHLAVLVADRGGTGNLCLYVDNTNQGGSVAITALGAMSATCGFSIGSFCNATGLYDGKVDEVGVWNRALTGEVAANNGHPAAGTEIYKLYNGTGSSGAGTTYPFTGV